MYLNTLPPQKKKKQQHTRIIFVSINIPASVSSVIWPLNCDLTLQPPNYSIEIYTHLKLGPADAIHNSK